MKEQPNIHQLSLFDNRLPECRGVQLEELYATYFECRKNKRNTINALQFEANYEQNLQQLCDEINNATYRVGRAVAFIVFKAVKRECSNERLSIARLVASTAVLIS